MKLLILKNEDYLELTSELTALIVHEIHGERGLIEEDGCTRYTEEAQDDFNDKLMDVEEKLRIARIYSEDDEVVIARNKKEGLKFARKCDVTGEGMNEGYCINDGEMYIKGHEAFLQHITDETEYKTIEEAFEDEYYYYT